MIDSVALTALIVSLVALLATTGQLLQQYFATADGYRRCQPSVMGLWAQKTKLRWRWREFRFETLFSVPRITYGRIHNGMGGVREIAGDSCSLIGTEESLKASMTFPGWSTFAARQYYNSDELACWVPLLIRLHRQGMEAVEHFPQSPGSMEYNTTIPVIQIIHKSWDFMPTEVVRPMASSTVSDIAIMARRLGMIWKSFDPGSGSMRAEGNGHIITSTMVRSLGTMLQYSFTSRKNAGDCWYIPFRGVDKLGFGLVEFDRRLFGSSMPRDLDVGSYHGIASTLWLLTSGLPRESNLPVGVLAFRTTSRTALRTELQTTLRTLFNEVKSESDFIPGLNDLVPLCSAMLSVSSPTFRNRWVNRIPAPNLYDKGVTSSLEGFRGLRKHLEDLVNTSSGRASAQLKYILACMVSLLEKFGSRWENEQEWEHWDYHAAGSQDKEAYAKGIVMQYHREMTAFLQDSNVDYCLLVGEHAVMAISPLSHDFNRLTTSMATYLEKLPDVALKVVERCHYWRPTITVTVGDVEDAWYTMMFRAFCWQRSHVMISDVAPLSSEYWDSKMPVYIG